MKWKPNLMTIETKRKINQDNCKIGTGRTGEEFEKT